MGVVFVGPGPFASCVKFIELREYLEEHPADNPEIYVEAPSRTQLPRT